MWGLADYLAQDVFAVGESGRTMTRALFSGAKTMGKNSKIEWTHHTFNPWWGCIKVSPACKHCYAEMWARRVGMQLWGAGSDRRFFSDAHWLQPTRWNREAQQAGERRRVFCASMADVFENRRDLDAARARLWPIIEATPNLDWLLLTKRPQHIARLAPWRNEWPRNVWLGTTAETQRWANERIPRLLEQRAAIHFASCEPLLGSLDLTPWLGAPAAENTRLNWVIAGGESGSAKARPMNPEWVTDLRDQCEDARVPFHFKQWGHWGPTPQRAGRDTVTFVDRTGHVLSLAKLGKHATGRVFDGHTWDGFPRAA
ncbi:MAG: phage Gp37/Gp68 family protein [Betaproteobacteria bacterium]|nr:phage Gp37/Gp68 family protein [Betaproteobacteria bacterium]